ncbi:hypothetical protein NDU88_004227 [Pleurodeles waltl]|uniref:Uncharacterized protein n=1 Tax=Pleurodeles waltl TaxID=8319 RepID=A0AAV7MB45_PLEWA|nr:hypothetical protein NDU88_004227 [Pleurodeles waltl]
MAGELRIQGSFGVTAARGGGGGWGATVETHWMGLAFSVELGEPRCGQGPEKQGLQDCRCGVTEKGAKPAREEEPQRRKNSEVCASHSTTEMLRALSIELKGGFETLNANQLKIRHFCKDLSKKIDELAGQTAILEAEVGTLKITLEENKERIQNLKVREEEAMAKLESQENNQRRNNLRFMRVPEGLEGDDLKGLVVRLIKT